jgi:hypothetical protein
LFSLRQKKGKKEEKEWTGRLDGLEGTRREAIMSKSCSSIAFSVATTALCAMVLLTGPRSAGAQEALFTFQRDCAADVSSLCAGYGWGLTMDTGAATLIAALIGAASILTVTILTTPFPAPAVTSSAARAVAWAGAIFLYFIAINYIGGAIVIATNWNGAYEDFGAVRVAFPIGVGGIFTVASIWATGRILAE